MLEVALVSSKLRIENKKIHVTDHRDVATRGKQNERTTERDMGKRTTPQYLGRGRLRENLFLTTSLPEL